MTPMFVYGWHSLVFFFPAFLPVPEQFQSTVRAILVSTVVTVLFFVVACLLHRLLVVTSCSAKKHPFAASAHLLTKDWLRPTYACTPVEYILCFSPFILKVCFGGPSHGRCKTCYIMIPNRKMQVPANEKIIAFGSFSYLKKGIVIFLYNHFYISVIPQLYSSIRKKERARPENYIA